MKITKTGVIAASCLLLTFAYACTTNDPTMPGWNDIPGMPGGDNNGGMGGNGTIQDDSQNPIDITIAQWDGAMATDGAQDVVGTDKDFYHELNKFTNTVTIAFAEDAATVTTSNEDILCNVTGAYVTVDMATNAVANTEIVISGKTADGGLKVYGGNKFKLTMNGVDITSQRGPAINSQCKKRIYVHLADGTTNRLQDPAKYTDDAYYLPTSVAADEDRKGAFFSEGNLIFSGKGALVIAGKRKHGLATDGYMWMRPGVTIAVTEAAKNAVHVKGDADDNIGFYMAGGLVYANVASEAGKGIKTDLNAEIAGGQLLLNTSGEAIYDEDEKDTSSAAGIKTDGDVIITGGTHKLTSSGTGGKGINADGAVTISGGETTVATTGGKYKYSADLTSSPKGVKADGDINISGGKLDISVTGVSDGSEGLESKATLNISGGEVYCYAYDDAINAAKAINISGGKVFALAKNNDGIDSNGSLVISGGLVIGLGAGAPESGLDCDNSNNFLIKGGTVIATGGTLQSAPSSQSTQRSVVYNGVTANKDAMITVLDNAGKPILTFKTPRSMSGASFFFSTADIASGATYTIETGGKLSGSTDDWNGWYGGGTWSSGTAVGSFTISGMVTTIGSNGMGGGGGFPGGGGGGFPGGW